MNSRHIFEFVSYQVKPPFWKLQVRVLTEKIRFSVAFFFEGGGVGWGGRGGGLPSPIKYIYIYIYIGSTSTP